MSESVSQESNPESVQDIADRVNNRSRRPQSQAFRDFIATGWSRPENDPEPLGAASYTPARRAAVSAAFPGERIVVPAGGYRVRNNDCDYKFRAHSAFIHLTGLEMDAEPDAVLVMEPNDHGHDATLFFAPRAGADTEEFFSDSRYGEYWVGPREDLESMQRLTGIPCRNIAEAPDAMTKDLGAISVRVVREADAQITESIDVARTQVQADLVAAAAGDDELAQGLSELRLLKDEHEIAQIRQAIDITRAGFDNVIERLPQAIGHRRGERVIEAAFDLASKVEGNGVGYDTIAASGNHACTLHWVKNTGKVTPGDLVLIDAGAEADSLYTADITRTLPVDGHFTEAQAKVYDAVLEASRAAFAKAAEHVDHPVRFGEIHDAAMNVIAHKLEEFGMLPVSAEESLSATGQQHRRWMVHGTSHHLGLDVHDCAQARAEMYTDGVLEPGMVFTIEPGLYFKAEDELVPDEFKGIGVRIEDDVLVTADGVESLSAGFPKTRAEVEAWVQGK
ncbi:aminopeptidase P family protein [Brevibacterium sp. 50QC2O2]|uniref:aminopeptidase P family protein n=1 Tax=Brevibacterium TaxID=1696 RepID=UPI00211BCF4E|nr:MULTISPECIES: aminopeptidase P family protein [unclassified Brevibacterium]MCQ9368428.1 aminopeptidase P family protein [Brevibacterium sp. 91QC2O2]MCQ9384756.1 aminopeptidase P family protein [Brevibacterium sp. 68QC2CO]MCQ9387519.1 aminopeptidase P family protein [Brevibacterium sp. 50QC2O2]